MADALLAGLHHALSRVGAVAAAVLEVKIRKLRTALAPLETTVDLYEVAVQLQFAAVLIAEPAGVHLVTSCRCLAPSAAGLSQGNSTRLVSVSATVDELAGVVVQQMIVVLSPLKWACRTRVAVVD